MNTCDAMRLMRLTSTVLEQRGLCGKWIPGQPTLCAAVAGHPQTCLRLADVRRRTAA